MYVLLLDVYHIYLSTCFLLYYDCINSRGHRHVLWTHYHDIIILDETTKVEGEEE